jgi:hypothetical protein
VSRACLAGSIRWPLASGADRERALGHGVDPQHLVAVVVRVFGIRFSSHDEAPIE